MPRSQSCPLYRGIFLTAFVVFIGKVASLNLEVRRVSVLPLQAVCYIVVSWLVVRIIIDVSTMAPSAKQEQENRNGKKKTRRHCQRTLQASRYSLIQVL